MISVARPKMSFLRLERAFEEVRSYMDLNGDKWLGEPQKKLGRPQLKLV